MGQQCRSPCPGSAEDRQLRVPLQDPVWRQEPRSQGHSLNLRGGLGKRRGREQFGLDEDSVQRSHVCRYGEGTRSPGDQFAVVVLGAGLQATVQPDQRPHHGFPTQAQRITKAVSQPGQQKSHRCADQR